MSAAPPLGTFVVAASLAGLPLCHPEPVQEIVFDEPPAARCGASDDRDRCRCLAYLRDCTLGGEQDCWTRARAVDPTVSALQFGALSRDGIDDAALESFCARYDAPEHAFVAP